MQPAPFPVSKRITDLLGSGLLMLLCAPLYVLVGILIWVSGRLRPEDRGPIVRYETRFSAGKPFKCYKFRVIKQHVLDRGGPVRSVVRAKVLEGDQNCTAVGKWLKKWYLDELPQLYHIWCGQMSLVGPRPFRVDDYDEEAAQAGVKLRTMRAGLTGLLQASKGISRLPSDPDPEREYIEKSRRLSPGRLWWYDLGIMLKTVRVLFQGKGL